MDRPDDVERLVEDWLTEPAATGQMWPEDVGEVDPEILAGFVAECLDLLEEAEQAVLTLETNPDDDAVHTIFRSFHTMKGTASFLALDHISELAHHAESLLGTVRDDRTRIDAELIDLLIRTIDLLEQSAHAAGAGLAPPVGLAACVRSLEAALHEPRSPRVESTDSRPQVPTRDAVPLQPESWTRVRTDRLDRLLETIGEIVVTQSMLGREAGVSLHHESALVQLIATATRNVRELQDLSIGMRLVPLRSAFRKLDRLTRDLARRSGKTVELVTDGEETEIDRNMIEELSDPLMHMVRNAVDHGIETAAERRAAGKPDIATLRLCAFQRGSNVVLQLRDDGRGLNSERIRAKAVQRGWLAPDATPSEAELLEFIVAPGFSTAAAVTELSGRGVGLDVVRRNLQALNGKLHVTSVAGQGCCFEIEVPLTLAIIDGMLVRVGAEHFILPVMNIQYSFRPTSDMLHTVVDRGEMVVLRDEVLPVVRLHRIFDVTDALVTPEQALLVVVATGDRRCALLVDELVAQQQVVSKPLSRTVGPVGGVSGAAILGNGRVGLILDLADVCNLALNEGPTPPVLSVA